MLVCTPSKREKSPSFYLDRFGRGDSQDLFTGESTVPYSTGDEFKYTPLPKEQYDQRLSVKRFCVLLAPTIPDVKKNRFSGVSSLFWLP